MLVRKLTLKDETRLEYFLSQYAETSMFLRSNLKAAGIEYQNKDYHGEYYGAFEAKGNIIGTLAHYWNGNIMMQTTELSTLARLTTLFKQNAFRPIAGILGSTLQVKKIITELSLSKLDYATNETDDLYAINLNLLNIPIKYNSEVFKMAKASEVDKTILLNWLKEYEIESLGKKVNTDFTQHIQRRAERLIEGNNCWILLNKHQPVSLSAFNAILPDIVQIGPVWTPPKYRNLGYARLLVSLTLEAAKTKNVKKAILFTNNPAAHKAYKAIGFKKIGTYHIALLKNPILLK